MKKTPWREVATTEVHWITDQLEVFDPQAPWQGSRVSHLLPPGFEAYVKILDFVWEDTMIPDFRGSKDRWRMHELSFDTVLPGLAPGRENERPFPYASERLKRTRWQALADKFALTVHPEFSASSFNRRTEDGGHWPARIVVPAEGTLSEPAFLELMTKLSLGSGGQHFYFSWDYQRMLHSQHPAENFILAGPAGTLPVNWPARVDLMPEYIWPHDRSWIVAMDYDLTFALVACAGSLAAKLAASNELETLSVSVQTRIDNSADQLTK